MRFHIPARCLVFSLEASPCLLAFVISFIWIFFGPAAPTTTVAASVLWMSPIVISTILAIVFIIIHGCDCFPNSNYLRKKTPLQQAVYDFVRSTSCTGTIYLSMWYLWWSLTCSLFDDLKLYNPHGGKKGFSLGEWAALGLVALVMVLFWLMFSVLCSIPAFKDLEKLQKIMNSNSSDGCEMMRSEEDKYDDA